MQIHHREQERKLKEQSSHLKWLQERELKQQELRQAHQLLRSPSKTSLPHSESIESELASSSPSVTDQLNIDVTAEEVREVAATEAKATSSGNLTPVAPAATPSSPLLTSLLRSPTASTAGQSSAAATKLSFPLSIFLFQEVIICCIQEVICIFRFTQHDVSWA